MYNRIFLVSFLKTKLTSFEFIKIIFFQRLFWFEPRYTGDDFRLGLCLQCLVFGIAFLLIYFFSSFKNSFTLFLVCLFIPISLTFLSLLYGSLLVYYRNKFLKQFHLLKTSHLFLLWKPYDWKFSLFSDYGSDEEADIIYTTHHFLKAWQNWSQWWNYIDEKRLEETITQWHLFISNQPKEIIQASWADNKHPLFELWKEHYQKINSLSHTL